jgi:hypothetical protein
MKPEEIQANDSQKYIAKRTKDWMEKNKIKPLKKFKHKYSPDNGRTYYGYNTEKELRLLQHKYPLKNERD